jgi:hypothetical protein
MRNPTPLVSSEVEKREPGARERFSTSLETNGKFWPDYGANS